MKYEEPDVNKTELTIITDKYSKLVISLDSFLSPPSYLSNMMVLREGVLKKSSR